MIFQLKLHGIAMQLYLSADRIIMSLLMCAININGKIILYPGKFTITVINLKISKLISI